jgi:hypothetical protein
MEAREKGAGPAVTVKAGRVPRAARYVNAGIAVVLVGFSAYHYTQPDQAWRSGTFEIACAALLLTAAFLVSHLKAMVIDLVVAAGVGGLGVRHLIHGGGWRTGSAEELFAVVLISTAIIIWRDRRRLKAGG